jgi:glucokinase
VSETAPTLPLAIGVDIGGTKIAAAVVDADGAIVDRTRRPTPGQDIPALEDAIVEMTAELAARHPVVALGIGIAGLVSADGDIVHIGTHLALDQAPLKESLERRIDLPVRLENDATAAAWAIYRFGVGAGADPLLVVTVGTGLGGGIVVGGELVRGAFGAAGEVGHTVLERDGRPCPCGDRGCLEQYASGRALVREARQMVRDHPGASHGLVARCEGDPAKLEGPAVTEAAREGDPGALRAFATVGAALGRGLASITNVLDPGVVVLGGGVSEAGALLLDPTRESFEAHVNGRGHRPAAELVLAGLGNDAGAIGAADLARSGSERS